MAFDEAKLARWGLLAGLGAAVLFVVSGAISGNPPYLTDSDQKILDYLTDHRDELRIGAYLMGLAGVLLLWFLGSLYGKLRPAEGANGRLSRVAVMGGVAATAIALVANGLAANAVLRPNPGVWRIANQLYGSTGFAVAVFVAAVSVVIWSTGLLPKWLGVAGELIAIGWFVEAAGVSTENDTIYVIGFVVFIVWAVWLAVLSVMLYRQDAPAA